MDSETAMSNRRTQLVLGIRMPFIKVPLTVPLHKFQEWPRLPDLTAGFAKQLMVAVAACLTRGGYSTSHD